MNKSIEIQNKKESINKNKIFTWIFIALNSISTILFISFLLVYFICLVTQNSHFLVSLFDFNGNMSIFVTWTIIISTLLSFIYSIFFSVYLYRQYKFSGNKVYLKFSYLVSPWYIGYLQIFGLILGFVMLSKFSKINDDIISTNSTNDIKKNSIQRSIINLISILVLIGMILLHVIFNNFFNQYLSFTPLFVYSFAAWIIFRNLIVHYIDLKEVKQNKKTLFTNLVLVFLGQFWWFLK